MVFKLRLYVFVFNVGVMYMMFVLVFVFVVMSGVYLLTTMDSKRYDVIDVVATLFFKVKII